MVNEDTMSTDMRMSMDVVDLDMAHDMAHGCPRCLGDGHQQITFKRLTHTVDFEDGSPVFTHWAPCPTNGEPILARFHPEGDATPAPALRGDPA